VNEKYTHCKNIINCNW